LAAGLVATFLPLRAVFVSGGLVMVCTALPVMLLVKEASPGNRPDRMESTRQALRDIGGDLRAAIVILLISQTFIYVAYAGGQQLILLRLIGLNQGGSGVAIGIAFAGMGLGAGLAGANSYRLVPLLGFKRLAMFGGLLLCICFGAAAFAPNTEFVEIAATLAGLSFGMGGPALQSMLGLESPRQVKATLFGAMSSATSLGQASGQLTAGLLAAAIGVRPSLGLVVAAAFALAATLWLWGREPPELVGSTRPLAAGSS